MGFNEKQLVTDKSYNIDGLSYIGAPKSNTAMFITNKAAGLLMALKNVKGCLVFAETGMDVPNDLIERHVFIFSERPQYEYAKLATKIAKQQFEKERKKQCMLVPEGYYVTEDVLIPEDAYIEPGCIIGPSVEIGKNARILAGSIIKNAVIGDNFYCNQGAVIGSNGFTMAEDENGVKVRIPTLGRVVIGNNVEIGSNDNISCGSAGDTVICDSVKLDALVSVAHDNYIGKNAEIAAGAILGGFVKIGENTFIGLNATIRNRIVIGDNVYVSMGAAVMKAVDDNCKVGGNPARSIKI